MRLPYFEARSGHKACLCMAGGRGGNGMDSIGDLCRRPPTAAGAMAPRVSKNVGTFPTENMTGKLLSSHH